ncbi:NAD-dependent epimerase [Varunaivibrio sulfuroxidans]|uniref:UDP-glucuronate 4-epimerase n=1 Tax=Varunaivibrio sulfuroxidans TaxID=1773489 RepID=A0A4R3JGE5_9PROT|nr:NAD-dependent epimerase [Varunaivibrio sulfuroxidans]TCS64982.1 UDP-glucuronate 4-epimerase [Varunaivibrio sulfuroxidans]WES29728.1 NAD-dependent epimerase [Varunaivibrio sulfuroxidans]
MTILITGSAGFIGSELSRRLLDAGHSVVGIDNLNDYYDVRLKEARLARIKDHPNFTEARIDLDDRTAVEDVFAKHRPQKVVNLAAQAGVRYSLENPHSYVDSNIVGFLNILEGCRAVQCRHLVFASSSSVYGTNAEMPFAVTDRVDHPISMYAATKRANELMAHTYSHLFAIPTSGLRFFTVYGPWGRPDMALFLFTKAILEGRPIDVFNHGDMKRSFTYIDDIVEGVLRVLDHIPTPAAAAAPEMPHESKSAPFRVYNIGSDKPESLMRYIEVLEDNLGLKAKKNMLGMQPGDVPATWADVDDLKTSVGYQPTTSVEDGVARFVAWYKDFYKI